MQNDVTTLLRDRAAVLPRAVLVQLGLVQVFARAHYLDFPWLVIACLVNGLLTLFWAPGWAVAIWLAQFVCVLAVARLVYARTIPATLTAERPEPLIHRLAAVRLAVSLSWASGIVFCWPYDDDTARMFLILIMAMSIATRTNTSAALPHLLLQQIAPPFVATLVLSLTSDHPIMWAIAATSFPLTILVMRHGMAYSRELRASLELQVDMLEAKAAAEAAGAAKSGYLAVLSHEIRTPLTGILGLTRLLQDGRLSARQRDQIETIRESGESLLSLVDDVLDMTKLEVGRLQIELAPFEPRALVGGVVRLMRCRADEKGLQLTVDIDEGVPHRLVGDALRLRQVLTNLIANALKFTETGSVSIRIGVEPLADGSVSFGGVVSDTGIGIPDDVSRRLFQAFVQADASVARRFGGSGLGLSISRGLVQAMGGELSFRSTPGKGSDFWFTVPMTVAEDQAESPEPATTVRPPHQRSLSILVVDDTPANRKVIRAFLQCAGHTVAEAASGEAAVESVSSGQFDLVLMDMRLPGIGGLEATRRIRSLADPVRARVPVLATTADTDPPDPKAARGAGLNGWLRKPFKAEDLAAAIAGLGGAVPSTRRAAGDDGSDDFDANALHSLARTVSYDELRSMLRLSHDTLAAVAAEIAAAMTSRDRDLVLQGAHRLRGTASSFGLSRLARLASDIQAGIGAADADPDWRRAAEAAAELPDAVDSAARHLAEFACEAAAGPESPAPLGAPLAEPRRTRAAVA